MIFINSNDPIVQEYLKKIYSLSLTTTLKNLQFYGIQNHFLSIKQIKELNSLVFKNFKYKWMFKKIINKKIIKVKNNIDNYVNLETLESLNIFPKKDIITVYDIKNRNKLYFHYKDLIKILNISLTNKWRYIPEPVNIKNPYINIKFTLPQFMSIYQQLKYKKNLPFIIHLFANSNFDITKFNNLYKKKLTEISCRNYIAELSEKNFKLLLNKYYIKDNSYIKKKICIKCLLKKQNLKSIFNNILYLIFLKKTNNNINIDKEDESFVFNEFKFYEIITNKFINLIEENFKELLDPTHCRKIIKCNIFKFKKFNT